MNQAIRRCLLSLLLFGIIAVAALPAAAQDDGVRLQILHTSDLEGGVNAIGDAPNFAAVVDGLEQDAAAQGIDSILLSAGDNYLPGPFFNASGDRSMRDVIQAAYNSHFGYDEGTLSNLREGVGRADITVMNLIGFDASAVGNHEFDPGTNIMGDAIGTDIRGETFEDVRWLGAQFPYLSANLDFSTDRLGGMATTDILPNTAFQSLPDDLEAAGAAPKLAPATTIELSNGDMVGVVGVTTQMVATISSPGDVTVLTAGADDMAALAGVVQPVIDQLTGMDVNKIVLVSHLQQIALEKELAGLLNGVDVIIAGGSDTLQADDTDTLRAGDEAAEAYPFVGESADGNPVLIVSTDGQYSYVGRLVVDFDADGNVVPDSVSADESGAYLTTDDGVAALWGDNDAFADGTKAGRVAALTGAVSGIVTERDGQVYGQTTVYLEGRRGAVRTEETNLGNLTADANLAAAQEMDPSVAVSFKNGGGIRAEIGTIDGMTGEFGPTAANEPAGKAAGDISQLDLESTLRFNNSLTMLTVTAEQLVNIIEHGVAASGPGSTPGRFPQVGGLAFSFDHDAQGIEFVINDDGDGTGEVATAGERVQSMAIIDGDGNVVDVIVQDGAVVGDASRPIRMVALNFLVGGGDGYPFDDYGTDIVETEMGEQEAMAAYLAANYSSTPYAIADTPASEDTRIQNLAAREDTVLANAPAADDAGSDDAGSDDAASNDSGSSAPSAGGQSYVVQPGDTLSGIALQFYGSATPASWLRIYEANAGTIGDNPSLIIPGQTLTIE